MHDKIRLSFERVASGSSTAAAFSDIYCCCCLISDLFYRLFLTVKEACKKNIKLN